jgi:hypothetical protein
VTQGFGGFAGLDFPAHSLPGNQSACGPSDHVLAPEPAAPGTAAADAEAACICATASRASKVSSQRPHRTQPSASRNWSGTTLKTVSQPGQRAVNVI